MKPSCVEAISEGSEGPAPRMGRICQDLRRLRASLEQGRTAHTRPPNHKTREELISRVALIARASMQQGRTAHPRPPMREKLISRPEVRCNARETRDTERDAERDAERLRDAS